MNESRESSINSTTPSDIRAWFIRTWNEIGASIAAMDMPRWNEIMMHEPRLKAFIEMGTEPDGEEYRLTRACFRGAVAALRARWPIVDELNEEDIELEKPYEC